MSSWRKKNLTSISCGENVHPRDCPRDIRVLDRYIARAGVIPYGIVKGQVYVLLGRQFYEDRKYDVWGDFGGGCSRKKSETAVNCARREFQEETRRLLDVDLYDATHIYLSNVRQEKYGNKGAVTHYTSKQLVMFVPVKVDWSLPMRFSQTEAKTRAEQEMEGVKWFKVQDLKKLREDKLSPALRSIMWFDLTKDGKMTSDAPGTRTDYILSLIDDDKEEFGIGVAKRIDIFKKYIGPVAVKQLQKVYAYQINIGKYLNGSYHLDVIYKVRQDDEYKFLKSVKLSPGDVRDIIKSLLAASVEMIDVDNNTIRYEIMR